MGVGDGGGACVRSGGVNGRDYCRIPGVIRELWEELPYSIPFFLKFFLNKGMRGFWVRLWEGGGARLDFVSWVKSQRSMSSMQGS